MRARWIAVGAAGLVALLALGYAYRLPLGFAYLKARSRPPQPFAETPVPPPPDYGDPAAWSALPWREDAADGAPEGASPDAQATARADVFFVHPTTYYRPRRWNQPLDDAAVNRFTDAVVRGGASALNACCRVFAPRYRQATLYAMPIFEPGAGGARAVDLATRDVEAAFAHYLEHWNRGRPFFLAAHSQGSLHARRLLERRISGTPLRDRMVAAYPIGYGVGRAALAESLPDVPVCDGPEAQHCLVTWNAVAPDGRRYGAAPEPVCVNPLTWRTDGARAPHAANRGAVFHPLPEDAGLPLSGLDGALLSLLEGLRGEGPERAVLEPGAADAQCVDGFLVVREIRAEHFPGAWGGSYHAYDLALYWANLRRNAVRRLERHLASRP